ncbi:MAG TPA: hypothetical protein VIP75_09555 [Acidothermales bacterium]
MCVIHRHRLIDPDGDTFADLEQLLDRRVTELTPKVETKIRALVKRAVS